LHNITTLSHGLYKIYRENYRISFNYNIQAIKPRIYSKVTYSYLAFIYLGGFHKLVALIFSKQKYFKYEMKLIYNIDVIKNISFMTKLKTLFNTKNYLLYIFMRKRVWKIFRNEKFVLIWINTKCQPTSKFYITY
jgi:hypothetical protein